MLETAIGLRTLPTLRDTRPVAPEHARPVSIVVAARDEERHIEGAVGTMLAQEYPAFEVVVVNDRSTDGTGAILDRLEERWREESERAAREGHTRPRLRVLHLDERPDGWLGKNHALHRGAAAADGEILLFTDADVMMRHDALSRAVGLLERRGLDHVAVAPRIHVGGPWARMALATFLLLFSAYFKPWRARSPRSRRHIGVGAFNLLRADAYRAIGGHTSIAMRPDDDLRLGHRLKEAGYRQAAAIGRNTVLVEWYPSLRAMAHGLRKNTFAAVGYRMLPILGGTVAAVVFTFWPVIALALTEGMALRLNLAIVLVAFVHHWDLAATYGQPRWVAFTYPIGGLFILWIVWAATLSTLRTGSIEWRGTRYSLEELRRGQAGAPRG